MRQLLDLAPVAVFFVAWLLGGIYAATAALMAACLLQCAVLKLRYGKVERMNAVVCALTVALGGLTLVLQNDAFIRVKPTVVYAVFAVALLAADFLFGKNLIRLAMGKFFSVPDAGWRRASCAWAAFFLGVAGFNLWAAGLSEAAWVQIKTFGYPAAVFAFAVGQVLVLGAKDSGGQQFVANNSAAAARADSDSPAARADSHSVAAVPNNESLRARVMRKLSVLNPVELEVRDDSAKHRGHREAGSGAHFQVRVVSPRFAGLSRLQRHRLVYETVGKPADIGLHALAVRALTPDEAGAPSSPRPTAHPIVQGGSPS